MQFTDLNNNSTGSFTFVRNKYGYLQMKTSSLSYPSFTALLNDFPGVPIVIKKYHFGTDRTGKEMLVVDKVVVNER